jgi:hypothetical protein
MRNINEYDEVAFEEAFADSNIAIQIKKDFDILSWDKHLPKHVYATERQFIGSRICTMTSFYYIEKLLEKNPDAIYDFGCGWNLFKKYIPNIIGISPENPEDPHSYYADQYDIFDEDFANNHQANYESAMAICSLNYRPLTEITNTVESFMSIIKPGGRGYISLDVAPMVSREDPSTLDDLFGTTTPIFHEVEDYIREKLSKLTCNYLVFDFDAEVNDPYDGNLRIVFEMPTE